ncbi:hypothetical protein GCM10027184_75690 [Saccharothrix stipae]
MDGVDTDGHLPRRWYLRNIRTPALAATGIKRRVRMYDLRHAHASWLLAGGTDIQTARERRGARSDDVQMPEGLSTITADRPSELHFSGGRYWD